MLQEKYYISRRKCQKTSYCAVYNDIYSIIHQIMVVYAEYNLMYRINSDGAFFKSLWQLFFL